eukprot:12399492-Karenia_brevis.AAC.1
MLIKSPDVIDIFRSIWSACGSVGCQHYGPIGLVLAVVRELGWAWLTPFEFTTQQGLSLRYLEMDAGEWEHAVRDAVRRCLWRAAATRRMDMQGLESGVDRISTQALLQSSRLTKYEQGMLRGIMPGAIWTEDRSFRAGRASSSICKHCGTESETHEHMWWRCPAWAEVRRRHSTAINSYVDSWPKCLSCCGLMPDGMD